MQNMIIYSSEEIKKVAEKALEYLLQIKRSSSEKGAQLLLLSGDLGAGKTTFTQALGQLLKVKERITSPTFIIQKEYETGDKEFEKLIHIDAYRLKGFADLELLGWKELINDPHTLIVIEWPERLSDANFSNGLLLKFFHQKGHSREISFHPL